ncbi:MAG: serpin family protein [Deltaproteobacteria bacterium]|nr:serpin family protein [Deltaproteobacteria bacterium]
MSRLALALLPLLTACHQEVEDLGAPRLVTERTAELASIVDGNSAFALELLAEVSPDAGENVFLSPFSISSALAMTYAGARGDTASQMAEVLHVDVADAVYHAQFGALTRDLDGDQGRPYTLNIANRLFPQVGFTLDAGFLAIQDQDYGAPVQALDYVADAEGARGVINGWVEEQTAGMVDELLGAGAVSADTRLVLANAVYFKADWASRFALDATADAPFQTPSGSVQVPMMHGSVEGAVGWADGLSVLRLPYLGDEVSFVALLPDQPDGLGALEAQLSVEQLDVWLAAAHEGEVDVALPRFELRTRAQLKEPLIALGMVDAFSGAADLSGIGDAPLYIDSVVHEAVVRVDEEGTEAAAATAVVTNELSMGPMFRADHPFLFLIRDELTGSILFMGRVADPS